MADFQKKRDKLKKAGARIVAVSTDGADDAAATVEDLGLSFAVGFGVDRDEVAEAIGTYANDDPPHLQPSDFVLRPNGEVALCVYSSGAVGRLHADEALEELEFLQKEED